MPLATCPDCGSHDIDRGPDHPDGRWYVICLDCDHEWLRGEPRPVRTAATNNIEVARQQFPTPVSASSEDVGRTATLKQRFLDEHPSPRENVAGYWARYQQIFSAEGLPHCDPQALKDFANTTTGANPGNMAVFNTAWNELGSNEAAARVRASIDYLLRGPNDVPPEDRLTRLIQGDSGLGMTGFRESLLTKVLCVVEEKRFVPILMYTGQAGKLEVASALYGVRMPSPDSTRWTKGRLIYWSNDLLCELAGDGFVNRVHMAEFLWWAKEQRS